MRLPCALHGYLPPRPLNHAHIHFLRVHTLGREPLCRLSSWRPNVAQTLSAAAEALQRGAKAIEETDSDLAIKMMREALDHYETEGKESMGADAYRATISLMIKGVWHNMTNRGLKRIARRVDGAGKSGTRAP